MKAYAKVERCPKCGESPKKIVEVVQEFSEFFLQKGDISSYSLVFLCTGERPKRLEAHCNCGNNRICGGLEILLLQTETTFIDFG